MRESASCANVLFHGDNLSVLRRYIDDSSVDLIYLDPPFKTETVYRMDGASRAAFDDTWTWNGEAEAALGMYMESVQPLGRALHAFELLLGRGPMLAYLVWLAPRLLELRRVLRPSGALNLHCDPRTSHYLKVLADTIMPAGSFRNEIVWYYGGRGAKAIARQFPRNHDIVLVYGGSSRAGRYSRQYVHRAFTPSEARARGFRQDAEGRWFKTAPRGDYTDHSLQQLASEGRIHRTRNGNARVKYFLRLDGESVVEDALVGDTWLDIPDAMHLGRERLGYPTQKPEALLERIVRSASEEGDTILDPVCGSGTTLAVAQRLGRRWIGVDSSALAIATTERRLREEFGDGVADVHRDAAERTERHPENL